jgi:hypothetical protein
MFSIILLVIYIVILALKVRSLRRSSTLMKPRSGILLRTGSGDSSDSSGSGTVGGTGLRAGSKRSGKKAEAAESRLPGNLSVQRDSQNDPVTLDALQTKVKELQQKLGIDVEGATGGREDASGGLSPQLDVEYIEDEQDFSDVLGDIQPQSDRRPESQEDGSDVRSFSSGYGYSKALSRKLRI